MLLAATVLDLADDCGEPAVGVVAVVEAERVEDVAEEAREAQQQHPAALELEPMLGSRASTQGRSGEPSRGP